MRCFVQLPHPGPEPEPDTVSWNRAGNPHKRKFMRLRGGEWIDEKDCKHTGDLLYAWGEWEPESIIVPDFKSPNGDPFAPKYLWDPYWIRRKDYSGLHNTDPFIFGNCFLYSNCRQNLKSLRSLAPGSLIVFGSCQGGKWVLDTVFVVQGGTRFNPRKSREDLHGKDKVSDTFLEVTGGPLSSESSNCSPAENCSPADELQLYYGATPDEREKFDGMFSFFPAKQAGDNSAFSRPPIELPKYFFTINNCQAARRTEVDNLCELSKQWNSIVEQVHKAGLVLGTHADLPPEGPL